MNKNRSQQKSLSFVICHLKKTSILDDKVMFNNVDSAVHFIYSHKYNIISAEDLSDMK